MKKSTRILLVGSALILLTNAVVLLGAAYNRSEEPESVLRLSQRELQHTRRSNFKDNSGITLSLNWRIMPEDSPQNNGYGMGYSAGRWGKPAWLNKAKLAELGFDVGRLATTPEYGRRNREARSREALLVLELDDQAYRQALARAEAHVEQSREALAGKPDSKEFQQRLKSAEESLKREQTSNSRLFVIDAGLDLQKLRGTYPDRSRYAIVHGLIHPMVLREKNDIQLGGNISELHPERINVPLDLREVFEGGGLFEVTVAFGKRLEPWLVAASKNMIVK